MQIATLTVVPLAPDCDVAFCCRERHDALVCPPTHGKFGTVPFYRVGADQIQVTI